MIASDIMPGFELYQPMGLKEAFGLLDRFGKDSWKLAGGNDSLDWFKARIKRPRAVIDLSAIKGLAGVREAADGIEIGAMTTLTAIERDPLIRTRFRVLADAAGKVASPQIRNTGTIGGNIAQHSRCWYYRSGLPCYRAGGDDCFARNPESVSREHALFDAGRCMAVNPSDVAPALAALDAQMVIQSSKGQRVVGPGEFFVNVDTDVTSLNCIRPNEILVAIRLPNAWAGAHSYFEKVADRQVWDFPLVNVAAALAVTNGLIERARIVCGAVSAVPRRLLAAEAAVLGKALGEETARLAGSLATRGAQPLTYNGFKVPLMAGLVTRAVREARV
jgi:xanthine dehydrogenase YagS FAD-binding subunit